MEMQLRTCVDKLEHGGGGGGKGMKQMAKVRSTGGETWSSGFMLSIEAAAATC